MRRDHQKNSYELRVYESVDDKNIILGYISQVYIIQNSIAKGL